MQISRRRFLGRAAALAAFPFLRARAASPSGKVNVAFVGVGCRGWDDLFMFASYPDLVNVVALCDTEIGGPRTLRALQAFPNAPRYRDFRKMFDERAKEIDAVCIATPDFSHFPAAMLAMSLGKAVYCEKPLGNTFREIALMAAAAKRHRVVTQMGNQGHSDGNYWQFRELVANGFIRDVVRVDAFMCADRRWHKWNGSMKTMPAGGERPPAELDWDTWQSQRPARAYDVNYVNGDWRCFYEYGNGALGDWGAHLFDTAWEFLRLGMPERIDVPRCDGATPAVFPMASTLDFRFPARGPGFPACTLTWRDGIGNFPAPLQNVTAKKWKRLGSGSELHLADGRVLHRGSHGAVTTLVAGADPEDPKIKSILRSYPRGKSGHYLNFINAVKGIEKANSDFAVSAPLSQVMALGALAQRLGAGSYKFDRAACRFVDNPRANAFLDGPPARKGWEEFERL